MQKRTLLLLAKSRFVFLIITTYNIVVMINVLTVGKTDENSCFAEVLQDFGYTCRLFESSCAQMHQILLKIQKDDYLVIRGDVSEMREKDLISVLKQLHKAGIHTILLFHTEFWKKVTGTRPFLIVPDPGEIQSACHADIRNENDAMRLLVKIHDHSHGNVLLPLKNENKGVFVCADGRQFVSGLPYDQTDHDSFARESMTAGFLAAYLSFHDYVKTFHYALSAYSISAWKGKPAGREETEDTYRMMKEKTIWMK